MVLAAFTAYTSRRLTGKDWLRMIRARIREHPEVTLDDHKQAIAAVHAQNWWDPPFTPNLVYGRSDTFEKALLAVGAPQRPRSESHDEREARRLAQLGAQPQEAA